MLSGVHLRRRNTQLPAPSPHRTCIVKNLSPSYVSENVVSDLQNCTILLLLRSSSSSSSSLVLHHTPGSGSRQGQAVSRRQAAGGGQATTAQQPHCIRSCGMQHFAEAKTSVAPQLHVNGC